MKTAEQAFLAVLEEINHQLDVRDYLEYVKQDGNLFEFLFDGHMECSIMFHRDGTVTEVVDTESSTFKNAQAWAQDVVRRLK